MRYDSEADLERALMSIDHVVKSTLRKRATRGSEQERMDPGDILTALKSLYDWYESIKDAIPEDVYNLAKEHLKAAWDARGVVRLQLLGKVRALLAPFRKNHPVLDKAVQAQARIKRKRTRKWSPGQTAAFQKAQAKRKAQKAARRKQRERSKEEEWLGIPEFAF